MKAAVLYGKEQVRVEDIEPLPLKPGEVRIQIEAALTCGTDLKVFKRGYHAKMIVPPAVFGHELSGVISEVRNADWCVGDRVVVANSASCGECFHCRNQQENICDNLLFLNGAYAESIVVPAPIVQKNLLRLKPETAFRDAALVEPLACVYNAFQRIAIVPGDTVLVIGAGPIGLMHAKVAFMAGAAKVYMNDLSTERLSLCRKVEPAIIALESAGLKERLAELTGGRGVSVCITAAPSADAQVLALEVAGVNGRVMFFGGLPEGKSTVPLDTNLVHYKQITITGTSRQSLIQYRQTLALVASRRLVVKDLVTMSTPLDEIRASFEQVMQGKGLKNVIEFA